jgi:putative zinc finger protein
VSEEETKPPFAEALRFLTDRERRRLADHLSPEELAGYHAGELAPEAEARIREHLALCRDCSDLLLDLVGFKKLTPPPGVAELTEGEVEEGWQAVRAKLGEGEEKMAEVVPIRAAPPTAADRQTGVLPWKLLAAALAVLAVSMGFWNLALTKGRTVEGGSAAVFESGGVLRGDEGGQLESMFSNQPAVFRFQTGERFRRYAGEIRVQGRETPVWDTEFTSSEIAPTEAKRGFVSFEVPPGALKPGTYIARLVPIIDGRRGGTIASLEFKVDAP